MRLQKLDLAKGQSNWTLRWFFGGGALEEIRESGSIQLFSSASSSFSLSFSLSLLLFGYLVSCCLSSLFSLVL